MKEKQSLFINSTSISTNQLQIWIIYLDVKWYVQNINNKLKGCLTTSQLMCRLSHYARALFLCTSWPRGTKMANHRARFKSTTRIPEFENRSVHKHCRASLYWSIFSEIHTEKYPKQLSQFTKIVLPNVFLQWATKKKLVKLVFQLNWKCSLRKRSKLRWREVELHV